MSYAPSVPGAVFVPVNGAVMNSTPYQTETNPYVVTPVDAASPTNQLALVPVTLQQNTAYSWPQQVQTYPVAAPSTVLVAVAPTPACLPHCTQENGMLDPDSLTADDTQDYVFYATRRFCKFCEQRKDCPQSITGLSTHFSITRRRFYDVLNVLESMGVCEKVGIDSIRWIGLDSIKPTLTRLRLEMDVENPNHTLEEIFAKEKLIGIGKTNILLLLLFPALRVKRLSLKKAAALLAHGVVKYRTMLGKLCQIAYILRAVDVVKRTALSCEIELRDYLCDFPILDSPLHPLTAPDTDCFSLSALLNRPRPAPALEWLSERRRCFENCQLASDAW